ncbi:response regulator [Elusimicrobiota bacterium]
MKYNIQKRVLVVDDDREIRFFCQQVLDRHGFVTNTAKSAEGAMHILQNNEYEVVLLDINLPRMDGIEMAGIIKEKYPHIRVIIMTGSAGMQDIEKALESGARSFIRKPFKISDLIQQIKDQL